MYVYLQNAADRFLNDVIYNAQKHATKFVLKLGSTGRNIKLISK